MKDLGLLTLRLGTGITMVAHGYPKLFGGPDKEPPKPMADALGENYEPAFKEGGPDNFAETLESMDVPMPRAAAYASGLAELLGGLALIFGLKTRLASLLILFNLGVAIRKAHWKTGFYGPGGFEHPLALGQSALALLLMGPGRLAIDCERTADRKADLRKKSERKLNRLRGQSERELKKLQKLSGEGIERLQEESGRGLTRLWSRSAPEIDRLQKLSEEGLQRLQEESERGFLKLRKKSKPALAKLQDTSERGFARLQEMAPSR